MSGIFRGAGLQEAQRSRVGVASGINGQFKVVEGIIPGRIRGKAAGRTMFKTLIHRQDQKFTGSRQSTAHQQPGQIRPDARRVTLIIPEDLLYTFGDSFTHKPFLL